MEALKIFGERLQALRTGRGLKQSEIAALLGCTVRHYQRLEHGEVNVPVLTLVALADYFQVTTDYLLGRTAAQL